MRVGAPGISIIFVCLLLMLSEKKTFPEFEDSKAFMRCYNDEGPGSDVEQAWNCIISTDSLSQMWTVLNSIIEKKLSSIYDQGNELCDYKPRPYNNEGEPGDLAQQDSISMADSLEDLDSKFQQLAAQCRPDIIQQSYMNQAASSHQNPHHHHHL